MFRVAAVLIVFLFGCVSGLVWDDGFTYRTVPAGEFDIAVWEKFTDNVSPVHIYIEGDGHAFDAWGQPTDDPTPQGTFLRDLAMSDGSANVVYMARPCQFIMSPSCTVSDWTNGRFSERIIKSMSSAVRQVAQTRPIILIGYSGGAMVSGLIIENNPDLNVKKWITIAGVLNHKIWTDYFGDSPLSASLSMNKLPNVAQLHYVAEKDTVVPMSLTLSIVNDGDVVVVPNATHDNFKNLKLNFDF